MAEKLKKFRRFFGSQTSFGISGVLQNLQNLIVVVVCLLMFWIMLVEIYQTSLVTLRAKNFQAIAGHLIYIFVLVELFRLMIYYLEEQRILLGSIVEVTIVSVLREVILEGALNISWEQIMGLCGLILTLTLTLALNHYKEKGRAKLQQITVPEPRPRHDQA
ncbi:MAG: phosphate-starvation-inducible PsiE family protein [Thermodesulfobacteriota bacterium]